MVTTRNLYLFILYILRPIHSCKHDSITVGFILVRNRFFASRFAEWAIVKSGVMISWYERICSSLEVTECYFDKVKKTFKLIFFFVKNTYTFSFNTRNLC